MSTDALAALREKLHQQAPWLDAPCDGDSCGGRCGSQKVIDVLFPADHPLRTGQPSEAMIEAAVNEFSSYIANAPVRMRDMIPGALRAALAVLREPLDK